MSERPEEVEGLWLTTRRSELLRKRRTADSTQIYVIRDGEFAKIGVANDPIVRMRDLQIGNPRQLELRYTIHVHNEHAVFLEASVHGVLRKKRERGEWFKVTDREAKRGISKAIDLVLADNEPVDGDDEFLAPEPVANTSASEAQYSTETPDSYEEWLKKVDPGRYYRVVERRAKKAGASEVDNG